MGEGIERDFRAVQNRDQLTVGNPTRVTNQQDS